MDALPGTPEGDELDILATLVEAYEDKNFPVAVPILSQPSNFAWIN
jgi:HTH-type transcriptional regulator/antitoxin HigA